MLSSMISTVECDKHIDKEVVVGIERFVILLYGCTSYDADINEARRNLFSQGELMHQIPSMRAASRQHIRRSVFQAKT